MKKTVIALFAASVLSVSGYAQGFYFRAGLGYAFPQAGQTIDGTGISYIGTQTIHSNQNVDYSIKGASFSSGLQGVIGIGYMFSEHIGIQLDGSIGIANKKNTLTLDSVSIGGTLSDVSVIQQAKSTFILMPQLVLQSGGDKVNVYGRFGVALPLNTQITNDQVQTNLPGTGAQEVDDFTFKIKNSFSLGFTATAGLQYKLNDRVSIWGEVSMLSMSVYIKESDFTSITANGQSYPLTSVSIPPVVKYSKHVTVDSTGDTAPTYSQPFSNVGINVGITFRLSQRERHHSARNNEDIDNNKPFRRR